jgi:hypothetical protein
MYSFCLARSDSCQTTVRACVRVGAGRIANQARTSNLGTRGTRASLRGEGMEGPTECWNEYVKFEKSRWSA